MYSLGIDIGSSSVKVSVLKISSGKSVASAYYPENELTINAPESGWAEQDPDIWWESFIGAFKKACNSNSIEPAEIQSIGISYQMHGLVVLDREGKVLRPSIIWCDGRAVPIGEEAYQELGEKFCAEALLNSPGNFTAAKLGWVKKHQPEIYNQVDTFMLPGDYIAYKLSGQKNTTASGLSEGIFWDFQKRKVSENLLSKMGISKKLVPDQVPTFGHQSAVSAYVSQLLGIKEGTPIAYRAGDQPNNAFSLNVLDPGEIAATAGTSGVIYAVTDKNAGDKAFRVNTFLHVSDKEEAARNGVLLCINGTGILNSWLRKHLGNGQLSYDEMNSIAKDAPIGSKGLKFFPFGNGAERVLENKYPKASLSGLDFNQHNNSHILRAAQEGIVFALRYGFDVLNEIGVVGKTIRAGKANMFLSPLFREIFVNTVGAKLELYNTDGAEGAARGGAFGAGFYSTLEETFSGLNCLQVDEPQPKLVDNYEQAYQDWKKELDTQLNN